MIGNPSHIDVVSTTLHLGLGSGRSDPWGQVIPMATVPGAGLDGHLVHQQKKGDGMGDEKKMNTVGRSDPALEFRSWGYS